MQFLDILHFFLLDKTDYKNKINSSTHFYFFLLSCTNLFQSNQISISGSYFNGCLATLIAFVEENQSSLKLEIPQEANSFLSLVEQRDT